MKEGSTVWLPNEVKVVLDDLKIIPEEPYHKVISRLIESLKLTEKWQRHWKGHEGESAVWCSICEACYPETNPCEHIKEKKQ